jgi:hypothetical protein
MKVKTKSGRIFDLKVGTMFNCSIQEPEWFPEPRADVFEVGFMEEGQETPVMKQEPEIGDFVAVDFQGDGPFGEIWLHGPITKIIPPRQAPYNWNGWFGDD